MMGTSHGRILDAGRIQVEVLIAALPCGSVC
jgi:hypothetical protein